MKMARPLAAGVRVSGTCRYLETERAGGHPDVVW